MWEEKGKVCPVTCREDTGAGEQSQPPPLPPPRFNREVDAVPTKEEAG